MALQDFGSLSLTNTPTGAQSKATAPAGQRRGGTTPLDSATIDRIVTEEGATGVRPTVLGIYGQESSGGTNARTSVDNAHGGMQIIPDTFNRFAKPGERIDNPEDNFRVGVRILKSLGDKYGNDPARLAVGYFSGEGNINPKGDTPYKEDRRDGNGKSVSAYVRDLVGRVGNAVVPEAKAETPAPDISKSPKYRDFIAKPQWAGLDDAQKEQARGAYFDRYVSPHLSAGERESQRMAFMAHATAFEAETSKKPEQPGVMSRIMGAGRAVLDAMGQGEATPEGAAINPSALASPATPASKIGVMGDAPVPAVTPTTSRAPVTPQFRDQVNRAYDAATPAERQRMAQAEGVVGQLVRERTGQFDAAPQTPAAGKFDTRAEARAGRLAADGADHQTADAFARTGAERGVAPGAELGTVGKSDFDFEAQQRFNKDPVFSNPVIRAAVKGFEGYRVGSLGLTQALFDATGNDEYADIARQGIADSQRRTTAMGEKGDGLQRNFEGAVSSIAQQLPALLAGVATGTEVVPLAAMFTQTFGQEYGQGRAQGLDGGQAAARAGIFGAFEVLGEKFGLGQTMQALKMAGRGAATKDIATVLAKGILKEIPGEQLTTLGQFLTDKVPGIGTNLEAGLAEYLQQAGDTLAQTVMQGGLMMGGTTGVSAGVRHLQGVQSQQSQAIAADQARENALNKAATFFQPARPKHASQAAAEQVVRDMAADAGMDVTNLLPAETTATPTAPPAPMAGPTEQWDAEDIDGLTNAVLAAEAAQGSADGTQPQPAVPTDVADPRGAAPDAGVGADQAIAGTGVVPGGDGARPSVVQAPAAGVVAVPGTDGPTDGQQALRGPAADEPPIAPGMTRLYHGGDVGRYDGRAWYSTSRDYANGYATKDGRKGAEVQFVDYPTDKLNALADPDGYGQTPAKGHVFNVELSTDETGPRKPLSATPLDAAAHEAATSPANDLPEPTDAQKAAGNYKMGHATLQGLDITIENPRGSTRSGTDVGGNAWSVDMANHYGYIKRTEGADGDHVDAFIGPNPDSSQVFVVDQVDPRTGKFDEHKVMLGFDSLDAARAGYLANYERGWKGAAAVTRMSMDEFKGWLKDGDTTKPLDPKAARPRTEAQARAAREQDLPATPAAPPKTEKSLKAERAARKRTGAQAAREKLKTENPFLAFICEFGLNPADRKDLGQEKGQRAIPGYGFVWRNSAPRVDELAMLAMESGFLSQSDIDASGDTGGTRKLAEMIQRAMAGEVQETHETAVEAAKGRREAEYQEYLLQQKEAEQEAADERDAILYAERAAFDILDDADIPFDLATNTDPANLTDDEIDRLFGFTAESRGGIQEGAAAPAGESAGNPAAPARAGPGSQGADEGLTLTSYTADDIRAQETEREAAAKSEAKAKREEDARARREEEQKELGDRRRQDASADNFQLGQDPMEALSGQADIFSAPPPAVAAKPAPAKKPKKKTEKQLREERRQQQLADYFAPGNIVKGYIGFDEVLAYHPATDGKPMSVTVHEVKKVGDDWVRLGKPQDARTHMTVPSERELKAGPADHVADGEATYSSPRADGQPFPNAPRRGPDPTEDVSAPAAEDGRTSPTDRLVRELREAIEEAPESEKDILRQELAKAEARLRESGKEVPVFSRAPAAGSEAFRRWFGASKVTRGGKPAVMYHSSDASFTVFDKSKLGSNTGHASAGLGFFTTPDRATSERYGQHLMPVVVRMVNPYRMGVDEFSGFEDVAESIRRREELQAEGYDGIYVAANDTVIVFEPNQIKSATDNRGTFDNGNSDILLARGAATSGLKAADLRGMIAPIQAEWTNGPKGGVEVVQSVDDLPSHLADFVRSTDGSSEQGFYLPKSDKVLLIADNIPTVERAQAVVFHEVYGHKGLRAFLPGDQYAEMMTRIRRANPKIARAADDWYAKYGIDSIMMYRDGGQTNAEAVRTVELLAVEEALADMAATQPAAGPVRKLLAALQAALRKIGLHAIADWMEGRSEAETFALLRAARDAVFGDTLHGDTHVAIAGEAPAFARADQPTGLPDAIIGGSLGSATSQADYAAAKAGDRVAGLSVAQALVTDDLVAKVKERIGDIKPIVVGVQSVEATGRNKIPLMASVVLAERLGATHSTDIVQANTPKRTGLNGLDRIFAAADFAGDVVAGGQYVLVDDTLTQGGTFAALASHIEENGGKVVAIVALTGKQYSAKLSPNPETLQRLREKYGDIEQDFRAATGYGFDALTQSEARYLAGFEPAQSVRDRVLAAGKQGGRGLGDGATAPEVKGDEPLFARAQQPVQHQTTLPLQGGASAGPKWQAPDPTRLDRVVYELQNRQVDLKRVQTAIRETVGAIPEQFDGYLKEEVYHGRVATRTSKFLERELRPLLEDMRSRGVSMDQLEAFLWARHAAERNAQIATINPELPDGGSGLTNKQAADYMAGADIKDSAGEIIIKGLDQAKAQDIKDLAARVDRMISGTNQILIQYGLENPDTIAAWTSVYKHYVPLKREDMDGVTPIGQGFSVKGSASKRALGSSRKVTDVLANIALAREAAITRGEKNRVTLSLYGLAVANPNPEFWTTDKAPMIKAIDPSTGLVVKRQDPSYKNKDNVIVVRVRGQDRTIAFNARDPRAMRIAETMKNLDVQPFGEIMGSVASVTRFLAAINTQYNPVFGLLNAVRDVQGAALNLATTPIADKRAFVLGKAPAALRAIWQAERYGNRASPWAKLYDQLQLAGGTTGYREIFRAGKERSEALQREIDSMDRGVPRKVLDYMLNWLDHYNTAIENAIRLTAFKAALDKGQSQEQAASIAKNLTVNFNRKGRLGRELGAMYAFFNAAVQGTARMLQTLDPRTRHGKAIIIGGIMVGVVQALVGAAAMDDDDWDSIPEFTKQRNFIIPLGKSYAMIPMPLGFNVLPNIGRILTEAISSGGAKWRQQIPDLLSVLLDNANPIGSGTFAQILAPTVADPIIALAENKDFTGRQIFKEDANQMRPKPGFQRSKDTASTLSKGIAYGANWASGGTDYTPGLVSPTPDQLDYVFGTITGGLGRELNKVYQSAELMAKGKDVPEYKKPVFGRFYGDFDGDSNVAGRYWNVVREVNEKRNELAGRQKDGGDAAGYLAAHPELRMIKAIEKTQTSIGKLNKAKDQIELNPNLREVDRTAQMEAIDEQITKMMRSVVTLAKETKSK